MTGRKIDVEYAQALEQVLGYLNFSSGATDSLFLSNLNFLYEKIESNAPGEPPWRVLAELFRGKLSELKTNSPTFQQADQAAAVIGLVFENVLPAYLAFHQDQLFHQTDRTLFNPFFVGRVCEAVLAQAAPWNDVERIVRGSLSTLNDFIGYRPVAVLENQKIEPYPHEWVRPIPLYIRGVGVAVGPNRLVVETALKLLQETESGILRAACLGPENLDELAVDPRAYDFDHPVNKRPNYHFGLWDPHQIDGRGYYRRFIVQQVTLDSLMHRVENPPKGISQEEIIFEAASVLAGTILMASGISGSGPDSHDSDATLTSLLPIIAEYRDEFYIQLFDRMSGPHRERLEKEASQKRQPFGGARQHLNAQLARRRASQLEHVHLAAIFARMGYPKAAMKQANIVPVASARMRCKIDSLLIDGDAAIDHLELARGADMVVESVGLLKRSIECGAMIDPWNILGFDAHFSLFPALENSIHDHRADELIDLVEQIFGYYSRLWSEAAAVDDQKLCERIRAQFKELADWWRQFASHEVSSVEASDSLDIYRAAEHVASALNLWHKGGAASGDVGFWAPHAEMFDSGAAYALVVEALLERRDFVAAMALLIHWLGQAQRVALENGERSIHQLLECWLVRLQATSDDAKETSLSRAKGWQLAKKMFDYLEANAESYWQVPSFELGPTRSGAAQDPFAEEGEEDDGNGVYGAAYEDVVYRDSTDDGIDGQLFETGSLSDDELEYESRRIGDRLAFLSTMARLWTLVATGPFVVYNKSDADDDEIDFEQVFQHWIADAARNHRNLLGLLDAVAAHPIPVPSSDHDSMVEYDRRRVAKESLLDRIVATCVETSGALRHLLAAATAYPITAGEAFQMPQRSEDELQVVRICACMLRGDLNGVSLHWPDLLEALAEHPLLYVPLAKGGDPRKIVATRVRQHSIQDLLAWLPRLGMLTETRQLLDTSRKMERDHPVGLGAVTEFDELFKIGYKSIVQCLVTSAETWHGDIKGKKRKDESTANLIECLENATESLLVSWLAHSRTLRLSVLEKVKDKDSWENLVEFIKSYGKELFTQKFFNLGNLRAILHQGVDVWLAQSEEESYDESFSRLLEDLDGELPRDDAIEHLTLVLEAIVENYGEYRDYNSTTTQSDRGELLYTLLDFLRLRTDYDRVSWNLKPVVWAHEILVRRGHNGAAKSWRRTLTERIKEEANKYLTRLARLQKKYAMSMPTVADRMGERFVRPMHIDRIRALVEPAIRGAGGEEPPNEFTLLEQETELLTREPTGVGLDVPTWLIAIEDEVEDVRGPSRIIGSAMQSEIIPQINITFEDARRQIDEWSSRD